MTHLSSPPSPFEARTWKETLQLLRDAWPIRIWKHDAFLTGHTPPDWPDFEGGHSSRTIRRPPGKRHTVPTFVCRLRDSMTAGVPL
jgi:hypothetical protein